MILPNFPKNCMKLKEFGPQGGGCTSKILLCRSATGKSPHKHFCICIVCPLTLITFVSLRLRVQNAVPAQPCVGKLGISLVLLNFLYCNFRLWFKTP